MADQGKAALESERDRQETMGLEIGNSECGHNESDWSKRPAAPVNPEIVGPGALKGRSFSRAVQAC
jgi:hypothetical protein